MSAGDFKKWQCPLLASCIIPERPLLPLLTYLIPRINCTPGSRSASLQNGPCTRTTQEGLKKKIRMHKNY